MTPPAILTDAQGRPYFLWDCDLTLAEFEQRLRDPDLQVRAYFVAKLMRQAKPDDVFQFVAVDAIEDLWPRLRGFLGNSRAFWTWLLDAWRRQDDGGR